ncbi:MAG: acetyl-CoA carboxylase biotin carboxylase subunit [Kiritimatiellae bacterium]|nr:acetyl-CoA carboxylase biotin carboxylase subunit [Kiritimatiellia bacterium]
MFGRILVANRGEIAVRVIRTCRQLGIETVAVYSTADRDSLHVALADRAICIGGPRAADSYLKMPAILSAAEVSGAEAIHPGFGFLSENAHFADICAKCNLGWIGPRAEVLRSMGDKAQARHLMRSAGVPVTPGSEGVVPDPDAAVALARTIGYPVLVKAIAGGGGKGMRVARSDAELRSAFLTAAQEARQAFGNGDCYLEKLVENARHVEVQLVADRHGNVYAIGERDCSLQRRHQKLLEETPSPAVTPPLRRHLLQAAVRAGKACGLDSVATVEFLWDASAQAFYFMEMNTRIQVEHPITEEVTGLDLVEAQLRAAAGEELSARDWDPRPAGHCLEVRLNAEDPARGFAPSPGRIRQLRWPGGPGVRVDSHAYVGYQIPPYYDSMIGKLVVRGRTRDEAIRRARRALSELDIEGVATTAELAAALLADSRFVRGAYDTAFLERFVAETLPS